LGLPLEAQHSIGGGGREGKKKTFVVILNRYFQVPLFFLFLLFLLAEIHIVAHSTREIVLEFDVPQETLRVYRN